MKKSRKEKYHLFLLYGYIVLSCNVFLPSCGSQEDIAVKAVPEILISSEEQDAAKWEQAATVSEEKQEASAQETPESTAEAAQETADEETAAEEAAQASPPEITIRMVGDILLHDRVEQYSLQEDGTYCYDTIFSDLKEEISEVDLAIVNQEVIIAGEEFGVSGYPCFNAPFALGDALIDTGFDVICHGTNHAMDKGKKGLQSCIRFWKTEHPEAAVLGIYETAEERDEITIFEQDGIRVAVLNYTYGTNGIPLPENMPYAVNLLEEKKVAEDIEKAEMLADFTVVCPHWGTEYVLEPTAQQKHWVEIFMEHGADLVIGTHPHVIEPIEMLKEEETGHEMLVYYSLGNFVNWTSSSGQGIANRMVGGMADVTIGPDENGDIMVKEYSVTALVTHLESERNGIYTTKLSDYTQELSLQNEIILQDSAFSKEYCVDLCDRVWGELWK